MRGLNDFNKREIKLLDNKILVSVPMRGLNDFNTSPAGELLPAEIGFRPHAGFK